MQSISSKPCRTCEGTGLVSVGDWSGGTTCPKCKGTGRLPGRVARVFRDPKHEREIVIEMRAEGLYVREKGRRIVYGPLSPFGILAAGARLYVRAKEQEKAGKRAARKVSRARR